MRRWAGIGSGSSGKVGLDHRLANDARMGFGSGARLANDARMGFGSWHRVANGARMGFGNGARVNEMLGRMERQQRRHRRVASHKRRGRGPQ